MPARSNTNPPLSRPSASAKVVALQGNVFKTGKKSYCIGAIADRERSENM